MVKECAVKAARQNPFPCRDLPRHPHSLSFPNSVWQRTSCNTFSRPVTIPMARADVRTGVGQHGFPNGSWGTGQNGVWKPGNDTFSVLPRLIPVHEPLKRIELRQP